MKKMMKEILGYCQERGIHSYSSEEKIVVPLSYRDREFHLFFTPGRAGIMVTLYTGFIFDDLDAFRAKLNSVIMGVEGFTLSLEADPYGRPEIIMQKEVSEGGNALVRVLVAAGTMVGAYKLLADELMVKTERRQTV